MSAGESTLEMEARMYWRAASDMRLMRDIGVAIDDDLMAEFEVLREFCEVPAVRKRFDDLLKEGGQCASSG